MRDVTESDTVRRVVRTLFAGKRIAPHLDLQMMPSHMRHIIVTPEQVRLVVQALVCSFGAPHDGITVAMHPANRFTLVIDFDDAMSMTIDLRETP